MKLKTLLMATTALAAATFFADAAMAGDHAGASGGSGDCDCWYVSVLGGANWTEDARYNNAALRTFPSSFFSGTYESGNYNSDTGFVVAAAAGTTLNSLVRGLRGELEISFRRNKYDGRYDVDFTSSGVLTGSTAGPLNGHISSFAVMANLWYDIDLGHFKPYFGGGIGWARSQYDINVFSNTFSSALTAVEDADSGFAYQLGAGFNYRVSKGAQLGLGYRYFQAADVKVPTVLGVVELEQKHQSLLLNLTLDVD